MLINRNPDDTPRMTPAMAERAMDFRQHIIHVMCVARDGDPEEGFCLTFFAVTPFLPAKGDKIDLENGRCCEVDRVYFKVTKELDGNGNAEIINLVPNVFAYLVAEPRQTED